MTHLLWLLQAVLGGVEGTVTSDAGAPIAGASVTIAALDRRATTDSTGRFSLPGIPARTWDVVVEAAGYHPTHLRVEVANRVVRVDVGLTPLVADATRSVLEVELRWADGGALVEMATVELDGQIRTAASGRVAYRDVPPGRRRIRARRLGFFPADTIVTLGEGARRVVLTMQPRPEALPALSVTAPRLPIAAPGDFTGLVLTGLTRLDREQLQSVPPAFEPDVLRALQSTAGIGAANDINAHLAVRGGAPEHTVYLLDGAPVLGPYHMFGLFGAFNPDAVDDAQILRGSLPARVGGALGSVVSLRSVRPDSLRVTGGATVLTSRLAGSGPLGGAGSWLLAGRRTNLGFGEGGPFGLDVPYWFWDGQGTLRFVPGAHQEITLTAYASGDKFSEDLFFVDESTAPLFSTWRNRVISATWRWAPVSRWNASLGLWYSGYHSTLALGDTTLRSDSAATRGAVRLGGVNATLGRSVGAGFVRFGLQHTINRAELIGDSLAPGYLDDRVDRRLAETSASVELEQRFEPVVLAPGIRAARWSVGDRWTFEPRLTVRWNAGRTLVISASAARTVQALYALRDDRLPILGVPFWSLPDSLEPRAGATSFELAVAAEPATGWAIEASAFHRRLSGLPRWRPTGERNLDQLAFDRGTATGFELSIWRRAGRLTGWAKYTPIVVTATQPDGSTYRPLWDRRHALDVVGQLRLGRWVVSQRVAVASGQPFWVEQGEFTGAEFDPLSGATRDRTDATFPIWSSVQATIPNYFRADLTASTSWHFGRVRLAPFAGLINLTGRRNVSGYRALANTVDGRVELIARRQLPRIPVLGIDFSIGLERVR